MEHGGSGARRDTLCAARHYLATSVAPATRAQPNGTLSSLRLVSDSILNHSAGRNANMFVTIDPGNTSRWLL